MFSNPTEFWEIANALTPGMLKCQGGHFCLGWSKTDYWLYLWGNGPTARVTPHFWLGDVTLFYDRHVTVLARWCCLWNGWFTAAASWTLFEQWALQKFNASDISDTPFSWHDPDHDLDHRPSSRWSFRSGQISLICIICSMYIMFAVCPVGSLRQPIFGCLLYTSPSPRD